MTRLPPLRTVGAWRRTAADRLAAAGVEAARFEADLLACHVLGVSRTGLFRDPDRELTRAEKRRLSRLLRRRTAREPVQYLLGTVEFCGLELRVTPAVLIPRPETEGLVERVLRRLEPDAEGPVLDVGTGSGCIALALAAARPRLRVRATDLSPAALQVARTNARRLGMAGRVRFLRADLTRSPRLPRRFRAVVSNPPYVAEGDLRLPPEVARHEPPLALFAPGDGLAIIRRLVTEAADRLEPGGFLALEIGEEQGPAVRDLLAAAGTWTEVRIETDLAGRTRYALAVRAGTTPRHDRGSTA